MSLDASREKKLNAENELKNTKKKDNTQPICIEEDEDEENEEDEKEN